MGGQDLLRRQVVGRDVEEALDGGGMEVEQEQPVGTGEGDDIGDQLGRDRLAGLRLALLAGVAVIGDDGGHPPRGRAPEGVQDDEELHQVLVDRVAGRLNHEDVVAPHRALDLDVDLAVRVAGDPRVGKRHADLSRDLLGQVAVGVAGDQLQGTPGRRLLAGVLDSGRHSSDHAFLRICRAGAPATVTPGGTSSSTTEPAPVLLPFPSLTGALSRVSTPTKAPSPISVRFLRTPS